MIKCIAIDDEPIALDLLREYAGRIPDISLECFTSPSQGMKRIKETVPDIVFLDIEMNSCNGITIARDLPRECCLIFTTAYAQYALEGFEADAVDFLHKPIFFARFEKALEKARTMLHAKNAAGIQDTITLKADYKNILIRLSDILVIEAMDNYVKVFRNGLPTVISQTTMKEMEILLPTAWFARVHSSYIVAISAVSAYTNRNLMLKGHKIPVPVGRTYSDTVRSLLRQSDKQRSIGGKP